MTRDICGKVAASFCPTIFYYHGAAFDPGKLAQPPNKTRHPFGFGRGGALAHISDDRQLARLLRTRRERPSRRASDQGEKLAPSHWFGPRPTTDIVGVRFGFKTGILGRLAITELQLTVRLLSAQAVEGDHVRTAKANRLARP